MSKKIALFFSVFLATVALILMLIIDVVNPHSFLDPLGALIRVIILCVFTFIWFKLFPSKFRKVRLHGFIILSVTVFLYTCSGVGLLKDEILWEEIKSK